MAMSHSGNLSVKIKGTINVMNLPKLRISTIKYINVENCLIASMIFVLRVDNCAVETNVHFAIAFKKKICLSFAAASVGNIQTMKLSNYTGFISHGSPTYVLLIQMSIDT